MYANPCPTVSPTATVSTLLQTSFPGFRPANKPAEGLSPLRHANLLIGKKANGSIGKLVWRPGGGFHGSCEECNFTSRSTENFPEMSCKCLTGGGNWDTTTVNLDDGVSVNHPSLLSLSERKINVSNHLQNNNGQLLCDWEL